MEIDEKALGQEPADPEITEDAPASEQQGAETEGHPESSSPLAEEGTQQQEAQQEGEQEEMAQAANADAAGADPLTSAEPQPADLTADAAPVADADTPAQPEADAEANAEAYAETGAVAPAEETPAEADAGPAPEGDDAHPMAALLQEEEEALSSIKRGDIVEGTIVRVSADEILIDVGAKTEGLIPGRELGRMSAERRESLIPGSTVMVYVITPEDRGGNVLVSLERAEEEKDWLAAEEYLDSKEAYEGVIDGFNKGGLIVRFGQLRGFVPASQVSVDRRRRAVGATPEERWGEMPGEPIVVKVIEVDRGRNRLILSERAASKESRAARKATLLDELEVGQVVKGRVISLTDFGAFVDLGGADGLVHLSELSWGHVTHPSEVLSIGDQVEVEIINLDRDRQRIGLSLKRQQDDPWLSLVGQYEVEQLVQGTVTKLTKFGAFARLVDTPEIEGLIHISELSDQRVAHPRDVVEENEVLTLRIVRIDTDRRRIGLSLKRVDSEAYLDSDWQTMVEESNAAPAADADAEAEETTPEAEVETEAVQEAEASAEAEVVEAVDEADAETDVDAEAEDETSEEEADADVDAEAEEEADDDGDEEVEEETGEEPEEDA